MGCNEYPLISSRNLLPLQPPSGRINTSNRCYISFKSTRTCCNSSDADGLNWFYLLAPGTSPSGSIAHWSEKTSAILLLCLAWPSNCEVSKGALCVALLQCWKWVCTQELLQLARLSDRGTTDQGLHREIQRGERHHYHLHSLLLRVPPACREYPEAKDPVECQAKKKLQLSVHRLPISDLFFLKLFHGMQVPPPPSSGRRCAVSLTLDKIPPQLHVCFWNIFTHFRHVITYFELCTIVDVCMQTLARSCWGVC